jgi:hypothetical protein
MRHSQGTQTDAGGGSGREFAAFLELTHRGMIA